MNSDKPPELSVERPPKPAIDDCFFYHAFDLKDGQTVGGPADYWDLRGVFGQYIGNYDLAGKSVFDFGTANGFLAFSAEEAGATSVTAFDSKSLADQQRVPFAGAPWLEDRAAWVRDHDASQTRLFNGFWFMHHEKQSRVRMLYGNANDLYASKDRFDVVIAGAVLEHLADPVSTIGILSRLAKEAMIFAFTPIDPAPGQYMRPLVPWDNPSHAFVWWTLSSGLFEQVLSNLGFEAQFLPSEATRVYDGKREPVPRQTIIARRR